MALHRLDERIALLQGMPIFGALRAETLAFLLARACTHHFDPGVYLFRQGDTADTMYVLERGAVSVLKCWDSIEMTLVTLGPGDCFGEMALLNLSTRSASVRAEIACEALEISLAALYELFEHDAEQFALIQMNIGREVARRLIVTDELLFRAMLRESGQDTLALQPTVVDHHARQHGDDEIERRTDA
ncbi:MAG: cyclic nucleotide-binding domain-containing protein [Leptothrix ochracea]|jgi:CRP/FNR family cyclic AMP-dependent transcriptional regulator|uniref:cyclic nucleotide-binding domain-containing protein n=1 Tax=Leptothrix ochracea TaxID=735331 RepID=UPI0034E2AECB